MCKRFEECNTCYRRRTPEESPRY
nr:unnamed protein product [Callosobruchus chinensis]